MESDWIYKQYLREVPCPEEIMNIKQFSDTFEDLLSHNALFGHFGYISMITYSDFLILCFYVFCHCISVCLFLLAFLSFLKILLFF